MNMTLSARERLAEALQGEELYFAVEEVLGSNGLILTSLFFRLRLDQFGHDPQVTPFCMKCGDALSVTKQETMACKPCDPRVQLSPFDSNFVILSPTEGLAPGDEELALPLHALGLPPTSLLTAELERCKAIVALNTIVSACFTLEGEERIALGELFREARNEKEVLSHTIGSNFALYSLLQDKLA